MSRCREIYQGNRIKGHQVQYLVTALLIKHLMTRYPRAWQVRAKHKAADPRWEDGRDLVVKHIRNLDRA